ncbi:MAG: phosphoglucosamine mutase [Actinomycetia bacterium]|nr:phosphoglucosamine mutase [Actinomycetes bacterium]
MKNLRKLFGTDGIRGLANRELTAELALKVGRAASRFLAEGKEGGRIIIGRDPRPSGDFLRCALAAGILSNGCSVLDAGIITTPAIALIAKILDLDGGIVISASHNPLEDNGIKLFAGKGQKLSDIHEKKIEDYITGKHEADCLPTGIGVGRYEDLDKASDIYLEYVCGKFNIDLEGLNIVIDCANGAASILAGKALARLGAEVKSYNTDMTGSKINDKCGSTHPGVLKKLVVREGADIGFAYDGDGDRVIACDSKGNILDGDSIIAFCAIDMVKNNMLRSNTIVTTIMANMGFDKLMNEYGINVLKTSVGDRYVLEKMIEIDSPLGGEQSGHIIFRDLSPTGDGIISSLEFLNALMRSKYEIDKIHGLIPRFPQELKNIRVADKDHIMDSDDIVSKVLEMEEFLEDRGRIVLRPSGTEPLIRIMVEAEQQSLVDHVIGELSHIIEEKSK